MFYYLYGELAYREGNMCVIDCNGVGYKLTVSMITADSLLTKLGKKVKLYTHLAVREDGVEIFGFLSNEEKECFNKLTSVSGIGPKVAMNILSAHTPENLAVAVATDDVTLLAKTPGIGKKTAQRIILELKDKLSFTISNDSTFESYSAVNLQSKSENISEAVEALMVLGYDKPTIMSGIKGVDPNMDPAEIIKHVLKKIAR